MEHYELTYIVSVKHLDDDLNVIVGKISGMIKELGGEITADNIIGRQRLAYPIKQSFQGTYVSVEFNGEPQSIIKLDAQLRLMNEIIRHLIIVKKIKTADEIKREAVIDEELRKEREAELKKMEKQDARPFAKPIEAPATPAVVTEAPVAVEATAEALDAAPVAEPVKESAKKEKVSLEDLDKKLDEILTDSII